MAANSIYERETSSFPITIGTALSLESIFNPRSAPFDPTREIPNHVNLHKYQFMYFNLWTLYRNLIACLDKSTFLMTKDDDLANALQSDIEVIQSLFQIEGMNICKPVFYVCSYNALTKLDSRIKLRQDNTELQKASKAKFLSVVQKLQRRLDIAMFDSEIVGNKTNSLLMTHVPYDLLSYKSFNKLDLLESNTGKLKTRHEWNSKYYQVIGSDMSRLPWLKQLLLIFGDRTLIHPADTKLRRLVMDIAEKYQWTQATTLDRVRLCWEMEIKEPYVLDFLKSL